MRVAVDLTSLLDQPTGVSAVTGRYVDELAAITDLQLVGFAVSWRGRDRLAGLGTRTGLSLVRRPMAARPLRAAWRRTDTPPIEWWTGRVDAVWGPNFVVPPARHAGRLVTVHDLTCLRFPSMVTGDVAQYPALLRRAIAGGAHVHAVSRFVADEVVDAFGVEEARVHVVPNGVDWERFDGGDASRGRRLARTDRYVLSLATLEPRKDLAALVAAFDAVAADDPDLGLVLAGADGWGAAEVASAIDAAHHRDRVVRIGYVDDPTRRDLLAGASLLAYPSRYEGFGLPPLEAMAAGVPVVATAAGAVPEVLGDAAVLVAVGDVDALAEGIGSVLADGDRRADLLAAGAARVRMFPWAASVAGLRDVLLEVGHSSG